MGIEFKQRFFPELQIKTKDFKSASYAYFEGIKYAKNSNCSLATSKFQKALELDSTFKYHSDVYAWIAACEYQRGHDSLAMDLQTIYFHYSETPAHPEFNWYQRFNYDSTHYLKKGERLDLDSLLKPGFHGARFTKPSLIYRPYIPGNNVPEIQTGVFQLGYFASYKRGHGILANLELPRRGMFQPNLAFVYFPNEMGYQFGNDFSLFQSFYNDAMIKLRTALSLYLYNRSGKDLYLPQISVTLSGSKFLTNFMALSASGKLNYFSEHNPYKYQFDDEMISLWQNNQISLKTTFFIQDHLYVGAGILNLMPQLHFGAYGVTMFLGLDRVAINLFSLSLSEI